MNGVANCSRAVTLMNYYLRRHFGAVTFCKLNSADAVSVPAAFHTFDAAPHPSVFGGVAPPRGCSTELQSNSEDVRGPNILAKRWGVMHTGDQISARWTLPAFITQSSQALFLAMGATWLPAPRVGHTRVRLCGLI